MDQLSVNISLLNKNYKLKVAAGAEEVLRGRVKQINDHATQLKEQFKGLDDFDYLAMSVMQFLSSLEQVGEQTEQQELSDKVQKILNMVKS
jgi:cell division protein ZapA (FtsZ GTPase activity inhibitor)